MQIKWPQSILSGAEIVSVCTAVSQVTLLYKEYVFELKAEVWAVSNAAKQYWKPVISFLNLRNLIAFFNFLWDKIYFPNHV